jgi:hypothetical protein
MAIVAKDFYFHNKEGIRNSTSDCWRDDLWDSWLVSGSRRCSTWRRGYTPCRQVYTNKTRAMPFIPTKSVACMPTSWLLGNVYTAKSSKGKKQDPDALKCWTIQLKQITWQKTSALRNNWGLGVGLTTTPWKRILSRNLKKQQPDTLAGRSF